MTDQIPTPNSLVDLFDIFSNYKDVFKNVAVLTEFLSPHCVFRRLRMRGSPLRIVQLPQEFAKFLLFLAEVQTERYLEIGVSTGGSWLAADSYLRAMVPGYRGSVGVDRSSKLREFDVYRERFMDVEFIHCNSQDLDVIEDFDVAFIDAHHTYESVMRDFLVVCDRCRFVAFHDIVLKECTVGKAWDEIKKRYEHWEFIDRSLPETCGIGVLKLKSVSPTRDFTSHF